MKVMKLRDEASFEQAAIMVIAELGSAQTVGALLQPQRSANAVLRWTDPDCDGRPSLAQALVCDLAYEAKAGKPGPFVSAYRSMLKEARNGRDLEPGSVLKETLDLPGAIGAVTDKIREIHQDTSEGGSTISPREKKEALNLIERAQRELEELRAALKKAK